MRCIVYPASGYIAQNIVEYLQRAGHELIDWHNQEEHPSESAWLAGLQQANAVFHVLHGFELHAKATALHLLKTVTPNAPVTFVGISTPLTWAATPVPSAQQAAVTASNTADNEAPAAQCPAVFTDKDAASRRPAAAALQTYHLEQLLLRCNRPGRLAAYVICPGVLYGAGEDDMQLHSLWRTAWEGNQPLTVYGSGANRLPTLHVSDLAAFAEAVVLQQPAGRYLLAADEVAVTQAELVAAIGQTLGNKQTQCLTGDSALLQPPPSPVLLLDLPFSASTLPQQGELMRTCRGGLLTHLPMVLQQFVQARGLTPLRILIRGPPASGKSHVAQRLASLYGLLHINIASLLAEVQLMDAETQKAAHAQLASKEGRISQPLMARIAQHLLARQPAAANQGWVMEGWPKGWAAARMFTSYGAVDSNAQKQLDKAANRRVTGAAPKDKPKSSGGTAVPAVPAGSTSGKDGDKGSKSRRVTGLSDDDGGINQINPDLLPHFLIELDVPDDELLRRVKTLAAAEVAAAAASVAAAASNSAAPSPSKGSASAGSAAKKPVSAAKKESGPAAGSGAAAVPSSHNNEKDFSRRMEAYRQLLQEDAADLSAKRAAILSAVQAATSQSPSPHDTPGRAARTPERSLSPNTKAGNQAGATTAAVEVVMPPDVKLPDHGGFVSYFVDAGAKYIKLGNPCLEAAVAAVAATAAAAPQHQQRQPVPLPELEQQLVDLIGPPHNYVGCPIPAAVQQGLDAAAAAAGGVESGSDAASSAAAAPGESCHTPGFMTPCSAANNAGAAVSGLAGLGVPCVDDIVAAAEALAAEQLSRDQQRLQSAAWPLTANLMSGVMPALMAGLVKVALNRPEDPCQVIADELFAAAEVAESSYQDPYDNPLYAIQSAKVEAKAAREAARAAAAAAKAAREQVAAATAQQEAEAAAAEAAAASALAMGAYGTATPADSATTAAGGAGQQRSRPSSAATGKSGRSAARATTPPPANAKGTKQAAAVKA